MKIYTRSGDEGETSLFSGARVPKDSLRVEAYGAVDELNALLGVARGLRSDEEIDEVLEVVQQNLFALGADLASPQGSKARGSLRPVGAERVKALEASIDRFSAGLEPLRQFILPGGSPAGAYLHLARTVCRRAERRAVTLAGREEINDQALAYLNRLSDLLFVLARVANHRAGVQEAVWESEAEE